MFDTRLIANAIYLIALALVSPIVLYRAIRHGRYRRGVHQKLFGLSAQQAASLTGGSVGATSTQPCIWIHAVSVGEVNLLSGVIDAITSRDPDVSIVVSTSTDTGYDLAVKRFGRDRVFFCPLDFSWAVRRTLRNLAPRQLILAELELWPNLIRTAEELNCPVMVMNGRLSQRSAGRYQKFQRLTRSTFARLSWVGAQDEQSHQRFRDCGTPAENVVTTGSLKFDDAPHTRDTPAVLNLQRWAGVDPWHRVWIFGSTQAGEEIIGLRTFKTLRDAHPELRMILVPRHPERFDVVAQLVRECGLKVHRRSRDQSLHKSQWDNDTVILVDTIGELRDWWGLSNIATVGGSFGNRGGQNMLEPAGYGAAVSFGPNTRNFRQIAETLLQADGAIRVQDETELKAFVTKCLDNQPAADALGRAAQEVIAKHRGATERTANAIIPQAKQSTHQKAA